MGKVVVVSADLIAAKATATRVAIASRASAPVRRA